MSERCFNCGEKPYMCRCVARGSVCIVISVALLVGAASYLLLKVLP